MSDTFEQSMDTPSARSFNDLNAIAQYFTRALMYDDKVPSHIYTAIIPYKTDMLVLKISQYDRNADPSQFAEECRELMNTSVCKYVQYCYNTNGCLQVQEANEYDVVRILLRQSVESPQPAQDGCNTTLLELKPKLYPTMFSKTGLHRFCSVEMHPVRLSSFCA